MRKMQKHFLFSIPFLTPLSALADAPEPTSGLSIISVAVAAAFGAAVSSAAVSYIFGAKNKHHHQKNGKVTTRTSSDDMYALAFESNPEPAALVERNSQGTFILSRCNPTFLRLAGLSRSAIGSDLFSTFEGKEGAADLASSCQESARTGRLIQREISLQGPNGTSLVTFNIVPSGSDPSKLVLVGQDITALRDEKIEINNANKKLESLAHFDALTKLPNRALLMDRLEQSIIYANRDMQKRALMFLDLDNFKIVNDTKGHEAGDILLIEAAKRISECARSNDTVARLGGDEFVVLLNDIKEGPEIGHVAERIISSLTTPFTIMGDDFHVGTSIGISVFPDDGSDAATLMKNADAAMYVSKENGKNRFTFFHEEMNAANNRRILLERETLSSLDDGTLNVFWLPHFELSSSRIFAAEAVPVWTSTLLSEASQEEMQPVLESGAVAKKLSERLLEAAALEYKAMQRDLHGQRVPVLVVPIAGSLLRERDFPGRVSSHMRSHGVPDNGIEIAAPEEALTGRDPKKTAATISALRNAGVRVALDRFGAGSVGLSRLAAIPVQTIRIDHKFISEIGKGPQSEAMINAAVSIARSLEAFSLASGVETTAQVQWLRRHGCRAACGPAYSRPLSATDFVERLRKQGGGASIAS